MSEQSSQFIGSIPENYDRGLGPHIFSDYAEDLARRAAGIDPVDVLEIASGTGIVTRKLRDYLPSATRLVATDLNPPMLEVAREKFAQDELVEFKPADAMALPFEDSEFDLIVCQFGVMFFPEKQQAFREARRVLRSGGRYLFNVWGSLTENPFAETVQTVVTQFYPDDPPGFYKVPFGYSDRSTVTSDLEAGGLKDLWCETITLDKEIADWELFARGIVFGNPIIDEINKRGDVQAEEIERAVLSALRDRFGREPTTMPLLATVYSGTAD